jgi:hypothetical protein
LTQAALQGKAPLHTFGELLAFMEAKKDDKPDKSAGNEAPSPEEPKPAT